MDINITGHYVVIRFHVTATDTGQTFQIVISIQLEYIIRSISELMSA